MPRLGTNLKLENALMLGKAYLADKEIKKAETSLSSFIKLAWPVIEPGNPYIHSWHIDAISRHLEAVADGTIRKLIINVPPRSGKSSIGAVMFPAWTWIREPHKKFLYTSYAIKLSYDDSRKTRTLIKSPWYQKNWGDRFSIIQDQQGHFENNKMGFRIAVSIDAGTTGKGGDCLYYDDLNNVGEMTSEAHIEKVIYYHEHVMASRLNNPKTGVRVNVQQRSSERDITGHILEKEYGWDVLTIPNEYEGGGKITSIGWKDPRTELGELFCPDRVGPKQTEEFKANPQRYAGQYQQRPAPSEGAVYKREWWNFYNPEGVTTGPVRMTIAPGKVVEKIPVTIPVAFEQVIQGWDLSFKDSKTSDLVSGQAWGRIGANAFLLARRSGRWDYPKTKQQMREMSAEFPCPEKMVEDKANGPAIISDLRNEIPGMIASPIDKGLHALAQSLTGYCEAGNIYLPNPDLFPWVLDLIEQYAMFPNGKHDDDISAASHALRRLFDSAANAGVPEFRVVPRIGEPENASHVKPDSEIAAEIEPIWRRWIAISPGQLGAALWICETPTKALRVYRELSLDGIDAHEAGRQIAEMSMPDVTAFMKLMNARAKWNIQFLMEKAAFDPVEPIGSYAELLEDGILSYESTSDSWIERQETKEKMKLAKFTSEMTEIEDGSIDRLRDLLRFSPPDFKQVPYDRRKAIALADKDAYQYNAYISAVEGKVFGEWPKIKIAASCKGVIRALGGFRRNEDATDHFLRALLIGASAPANALMTQKVPKDAPYPFAVPGSGSGRMGRRFGRRVA
jgi:predicted phage terminase large subunit-like protein